MMNCDVTDPILWHHQKNQIDKGRRAHFSHKCLYNGQGWKTRLMGIHWWEKYLPFLKKEAHT